MPLILQCLFLLGIAAKSLSMSSSLLFDSLLSSTATIYDDDTIITLKSLTSSTPREAIELVTVSSYPPRDARKLESVASSFPKEDTSNPNVSKLSLLTDAGVLNSVNHTAIDSGPPKNGNTPLSDTTPDTNTTLLTSDPHQRGTISGNAMQQLIKNNTNAERSSNSLLLSTTASPSHLMEKTNDSVSVPRTMPRTEVEKASTTPVTLWSTTPVTLWSTPNSTTTSFITVMTRRCCNLEHYISDNHECVATTDPVSFSPITQVEKDPESVSYHFQWETKGVDCPKGYQLKEIAFSANTTLLKPYKTESFLQWDGISARDYCIGQLAQDNYTALLCVPDVEKLCSDAPCLRMCCGPGEIKAGRTCEPGKPNVNMSFHTISGEKTTPPEGLQLIHFRSKCSYKTAVQFSRIHGYPYYLLSSGKLFIRKTGEVIDSSKFCLEYYDGLNDTAVVYCFDPPSPLQQWKNFLRPIGFLISIVFLVIVVICHLITRRLRNVQGLCFMAYSITLLMAMTGFYTVATFTKHISYSHCVFNASFNQFSLLSAFFWLTVMCFDIWRVIRATVKCIPLSGILENGKQKIILYSIFGFGCPLAISLVTIILQSLPETSSKGLIVPGFGKDSCSFAGNLEEFIYFYMFIMILNITCLILLCHSIYMLCEADQGFSCFRRRTQSRAFNRKHLMLFRQRFGLFIMMAVCWSTEVLSLQIKPEDIWVVTDLLNTLQGLIVFIIFVISRKKRLLVKASVMRHFGNISSTVGQSSSQTESAESSRQTEASGQEMAVVPGSSERPNAGPGSDQDKAKDDAPPVERDQSARQGYANEGFETHGELEAEKNRKGHV